MNVKKTKSSKKIVLKITMSMTGRGRKERKHNVKEGGAHTLIMGFVLSSH